MARIPQISPDTATAEQLTLWRETEKTHSISNMKATLIHSPEALRAVLEWYPLLAKVKPFLGERLAILYCNAISRANHCQLCSLFMRRAIVSWGEDPDNLKLDARDQAVVDFGKQLAIDPNGISDDLFARVRKNFSDAAIVDLTAFGALMIVNNVFNSALKVDVDTSLDSFKVAPEVLFA